MIGTTVVPGSPGADPVTDCVSAQSLTVTPAEGWQVIPVDAELTACDGGAVYVSPADVNAG